MTKLELLQELHDAKEGLVFGLEDPDGDCGDAEASMQDAVKAIDNAISFLSAEVLK